MILHTSQIDRIYQYLLIGSMFLLPLTVLGNNIFIWLTVLIWLFSGNYLNKTQEILANKLALASILFFSLHLLALFWTENFGWGVEMIRKMLPFLFVLPIFLTIARKDNINYYVYAFLIAIGISEVFSYLVWFELIEPFGSATIANPTPVMGHISYNPFLAFAIYLTLNKLLFQRPLSPLLRTILTFFVISMTFNMFITAGRAGQVMFFASLAVLTFQFFRGSQVKATIISAIIIFVIGFGSYNFSALFKNRIQQVSYDLALFTTNPNTSVGHRLVFATNTIEIIKTAPFIGVGTGDFPAEYTKINLINSPSVKSTVQPHNMYLYIQAQLGLLGLVSFLWIFYVQFQFARASKDQFIHHAGVALPFLFLIIMLSDSYLLGHFTSNLFILFSSFIYSNKSISES
jgi:O-antigen ligase